MTEQSEVPGIGPRSGLMIIGEYPNAEDELMQEPFSDRSGELLRKLLKEVGIERHSYLTYAVKSKPGDNGPTEQEVAAAWPLLQEEIRSVDPKVILSLGKLPTRLLLNLKKSLKLADHLGEHSFQGKPMFVGYHPNYVLQHGKKTVLQFKGLLAAAKEKLFVSVDQ